MRNSCIILIGVVGICIATTEAMACSWVNYQVYFPFRSAEINAQAQNTLMQISRSGRGRRIDARCERLVVDAYADGAEAALPNERMDIARAEMVRDFLGKQGELALGQVELRPMGDKLYNNLGAGIPEPSNRIVHAYWASKEGRTRCDPKSKLDPPGPCGNRYLHCYLELSDGTICNGQDSPNPNPTTYSVDEKGEELK